MRTAALLGLIVIAGLHGPGLAAGATCLGDLRLDFTQDSLGPWLIPWSGPPISGVVPVVRGGRLEIHRPPGVGTNAGTSVNLAGDYEICGDFDIRVDFDLAHFPKPDSGRSIYASLRVDERAGAGYGGIERFITGVLRPCLPFTDSYKYWRNATEDCLANFIATDVSRGGLRITRRGSQWTLYHRGDEDWEAARTTEGGTGPVGFAIYVGGDAPDSHLVRFDDLRITSDRANPPASPVPPLNERLTAARRAFAEGRDDHVLSTLTEMLLPLSRTTPDTALVDRAWDLILEAGPRQARRGDHDRRRAPTRDDTLVTLREVEERAFGLMQHGHQKAGVLLTERSLAMRAATGLPDERLVAVALHRMGNALFALGDYRRGMECYTRARPIYAAFEGVHDRVHSVEANRALMHLLLGELGEARRIWEPLIADFEAHHRDRQSLLATNYMNLGELYLRMGEDPRLAGRMFERCMELRLAAGHTREFLGDPLMMLAGTYTATGEPNRALTILDSLVKEDIVRPDNSNIGDVEMHHAEALLMVGRLDEAERAAVKARDLLAGAWAFDHARLCDANQVLAKVLIARGDWPRALAAAESAAVFARRWLPDPHPERARALLLWARAAAGSGRRDEAFATAIEAERRLREAMRILAPELGDAAAFRIDRDRAAALGVAAEVIPPGPDAARVMLDAIVRSRALILDLRVARLPLGGADSVGQAMREHFARTCTRLANLAMRPRDRSGAAEDRQEIEKALAERRRAEQALAEYSAPFARQRSRGAAGLDEVLAAIPEGAALVSYVRLDPDVPSPQPPPSHGDGRARYAAFVVPPGGQDPIHIPLGAAHNVDRVIGRWREAVEEGSPSRWGTAHRVGIELRRILWDPVAARLAGARSVVIVPDGAIQLVSVGALPSGAGRFVVETTPPISVLAAERDLVRPERPETGRGLLAMGGVDYQRASPMEPDAQGNARLAMRRDTYRSARASCAGFAQLELSPLPAAAAEVREIADLWRASAPDSEFRLLTGAAASEEHLKALAPAYRFLHLATHGFFLGPECDSTHVAVGALRDSPLLRSGLALSGFNARSAASIDGEDGVLTAEEVAALDLGAVDCVVLSACESGVGLPTAGEGVLGLRRAFQLAGARTLVTALWRVEDRASQSWMRSFHTACARGRSPAEAAAAASRAMIADLRRGGRTVTAAHWGAFLVVGN